MLALFGGNPVIKKSPNRYSWYRNFQFDELKHIIIESKLSGFLANTNESHFGGEIVRRFEKAWKNEFESDFALGFNSWTSGLEACIAALKLPPKTEVIVPAWTMSATVAAIVTNNLTPRFTDISLYDFNLDIEQVQSSITHNTSAIIGVDIFGKPCNAEILRMICDAKGLKLVIDAAQTPKAKILDKRSTHFSDVGGYSLNRHKHLQVGEGGVVVTNNPVYSERIALYRNHAEVTNLTEDQTIAVGHNLRMGEIEALLGEFQLLNIERLITDRRFYGNYLVKGLRRINWLILPEPKFYEEHDFYILGMRIDFSQFPVDRDTLIEALAAEGLQGLIGRYAQLHKLKSFRNYPKNSLENTEKLFNQSFLGLYLCGHEYSDSDLDRIIEVFEKIDKYKDSLVIK